MKEACGTCRFYRDDAKGMSGYGTCHRYPESLRTNDGNWCGEWSLPHNAGEGEV